jgi:2-polyprenyl-6-methoxyphenol hydroxylase-like FAD-dependent oxidoreductase
MANIRTVLISGASIAGPALAYWLKRNGFVPTLVERAPKPRPGGQAIDIRGKALDVVERMGLLDPARAKRTQMKGVSLQDEFGREIWRSEEKTFTGGRFDNDDVELLRDDLSNLLLGNIGDCEMIFDESIVALTDGPDGVEVQFRSGPTRIFDLVLGADGVHSNVRKLVFGPEEPFLKPLGVGLAIFSTENYLCLKDWQVSFRDETRGFGYLIYPVRDNTELRVNIGIGAGLAEDRYGDSEAQKALVAEKSAGWGWEVPNFIERMWQSTDFYFGALAQSVMDRWSKGRIGLAGDAGYCPSPFSGQGTSLALVGAYVLAQELGRNPSDHTKAFAVYETRMRPYVLKNQALAWRDRGAPEEEAEAMMQEAKNGIDLDKLR